MMDSFAAAHLIGTAISGSEPRILERLPFKVSEEARRTAPPPTVWSGDVVVVIIRPPAMADSPSLHLLKVTGGALILFKMAFGGNRGRFSF
jgi:hypothetical protein